MLLLIQEENKMKAVQDAKEKEVIDRRVAYEKCRGGCECEGAECLAAGLYLCRYCNTYKKKKCGVAKCLRQYADAGCTDLPLPKKARAKAAKPAAPRASKKRERAPSQEPAESEDESESQDPSEEQRCVVLLL